MATKIKQYQKGDIVTVKCGSKTEKVTISSVNKWYIECKDSRIFHVETLKCTRNLWEIVETVNKPKGLPRGKSWKEQGLKGRTTKNKPKQ